MERTNRRDFLKRAGQLCAVAGVGVGAGATVLSCVPATNGVGTPTPEPTVLPTDVAATPTPTALPSPTPPPTATPSPAGKEWPWPYSKLEVERVRKLGHRQFYAGDCCYGAFSAIIGALTDQVGEPFASLPTDMMRYGKGGVYGYGSLCGALNGAAAAIQLVTDEQTGNKVVTELMNWYAATALPTDIANQYAVNHEYLVEELKTDEALPQNAAGDVLCHVSVGKWCQVSQYASGSEHRKERCARLAGDVAAKAVELLNAVADETFTPILTSPGEQSGCMSCHKPGTDFAAGNITQGKMNCASCHVSPVVPQHPW